MKEAQAEEESDKEEVEEKEDQEDENEGEDEEDGFKKPLPVSSQRKISLLKYKLA